MTPLNPPATLDIAANLTAIQQRIANAARRANRQPEEITLVAVSKTRPFADIERALSAGQHEFGENRLEELSEKLPLAQERGGDNAIHWHMIGTIQSRKSAEVVAAWQRGGLVLIHSVDTLKLARRLSRDAAASGVVLSVLLEINISGEESKHGFTTHELRQVMAELVALPALSIQGLMTMAPFEVAPEATRPFFGGLRQLRAELANAWPQVNLQHLSMGMTNDFEIAIEEGATIVRIGSAIFSSEPAA